MPKGYGLTEAVKDAIWELRAQGLSEAEIGRWLGFPRATVSRYLARVGGIRPGPRRRPARCLGLNEREEISRGIASGHSARAIARTLGRSHTTVAREINRCGGRRRYRAHAAEREARADPAATADEARALLGAATPRLRASARGPLPRADRGLAQDPIPRE
jgi:transposase, IS30 family